MKDPGHDVPGEELLERVLDAQRTQSRPALDGADQVRLRELQQLVARLRERLSDQRVVTGAAADSPGRLAGRILGRTTREELSLGGDLRLIRDYLRRGLRTSPLVRVAAASLLIHLAALPVLAYWAFLVPEAPVDLGYESWDQAHPSLPYPEAGEQVSPPLLPIVEPDQEPTVRTLPGTLERER